jgi:DNA ligase (NAD+)
MLNSKRAVVVDIEFMVTAAGNVRPVIVLDDNGQVVLRNIPALQALSVLVGDTVEMDDHHGIYAIIKSERPQDAHPVHIPQDCPSCGSGLVTHSRGRGLMCVKGHRCKAQVIPRVERYLKLMKAPLTTVEVTGLYDNGWVKSIPDLYSLRGMALVELGMSQRDALDWMTMLDDPHAIEFSTHLYALGILGISQSAAEDLASAFGNYDALLKRLESDPSELATTYGVPGISCYYRKPHGKEVLEAMRDILR